MDKLMKMMVDMQLDKNINDFLVENTNEEGIDAGKLYFGETTFVGNEKNNSDNNKYRVLIDSSVRTPHNRFFIDIISRESLGWFGGFTGIANVDNTGPCVSNIELLSQKSEKLRMSLEEIEIFVNECNKSNIKRKSK